jgi:hypothetical protein
VTARLFLGERVLRDLPLDIDPAEVLRFQGYKRGGEPPPAPVRAIFEEALAAGRELMAPRAVVRWAMVHRHTDGGVDAGGLVVSMSGLARRWGPIEYVAAAICTLGDALEQRVRALWDARELPLAAMLDSVGSGAVESLAEFVNDLLCQEGVPAGLRVTNRVSPGYGDWDVADQRRLFDFVSGERIGVSLNEACFMTPTKSISLLVGAGRAARVDDYVSQCARCWMRDCGYRRVPAARTVHR